MPQLSGLIFWSSWKTGIVNLIPLLSRRKNWREVPKNEKLGPKVTPSRTVPYDSRRSTLNVATSAACRVVRIVQDFTAHPSPPDKPLRPVPSALRRMWTRLNQPIYPSPCSKLEKNLTRKTSSLIAYRITFVCTLLIGLLDFDECSNGGADLCPNGTRCQNQKGTYSCEGKCCIAPIQILVEFSAEMSIAKDPDAARDFLQPAAWQWQCWQLKSAPPWAVRSHSSGLCFVVLQLSVGALRCCW